MPDPISSSSRSIPWCVNPEDEALGSAEPATTALQAGVTSGAAGEGDMLPGAAVLSRRFEEGHGAFLAAAAGGQEAGVVAGAQPGAKATGLPPNPEDQVNLQVGLPRLESHRTLGPAHLTGGIDVLNANAHLGSQNSDGSQGENVGAMATGIGVDGTVEYSGWSLTVGLSASLGASVSSGEGRDLDGDGKAERCFSVSFGPVTLGECDEL
jgi:hypothetical protein